MRQQIRLTPRNTEDFPWSKKGNRAVRVNKRVQCLCRKEEEALGRGPPNGLSLRASNERERARAFEVERAKSFGGRSISLAGRITAQLEKMPRGREQG